MTVFSPMRVIILTTILMSTCAPIRNVMAQGTSVPMAAFLKQADLPTFLKEANARDWKAPYIYSRWHVDNIAPKDKREPLLRDRALGKQLVDVLGQWAAKIRTPAAPDEDFEHAKLLLDLADWIGTPNGYGNIALAQRSQDIATVPMSRLVVNLEYPLEKTQTLIKRLDSGSPDPAIYAEMLNREAGIQIVTAKMAAEKASTFAIGQILTKLRQEPDPIGISHAIRQIVLDSPLARQSDLRIFLDDDTNGAVFTLSRMWDSKRHAYVGNRSVNVRNLPALAEFRRVVGYFPETHDDFRRASDRHKENHLRYGRARSVYFRIRRGEFLDHDTIEEEKNAREQKTLREIQEDVRRFNSGAPQK